ncbi:TIGR02584 family CRISPR-associated protein [Melaminivora suipulveris]|uniref:TIGR02584 family CRISPR-associated protein n=2 Tax=Melaminivora suipulveris TaxID=2109913 RepID=A0A2R3QBU2_9BURK|nr:TIGR02584 family CRISPR-associated protein [Melaminivora suipulveris]
MISPPAHAALPGEPPNAMPRRILLAVTGLSPQVLTETLYALAVAPEPGAAPFVPTEIHLLTTDSGARLARTALLHPDGGQFHALLADYPTLGRPAFGEQHIHVIHDAAGQPLADIRTPEENACAADSITALMAELTRDEHAALHVSIAGGRKTMGFYLGYAFSLFARPQDELSHVLVSSPFENHPEFFYPPATARRLAARDGQHLDTADARITLARIPVVRLRHGQPQALLQRRASFGETVAAIQQSLEPARLVIELRQRRVQCGDTLVPLPPAQLAWLAWWARQSLAGRGPQNWRSADAGEFLALYRRVVTIDAVAYEHASKRLKDGMEKEFFEQNNAKLERALKDRLGLAAAPYLLHTSGRRPHTARALALTPQAITLID